MGIKTFKPTSKGVRFRTNSDYADITSSVPEKLQKLLNQKAVVTIEAVLQFVTKVAVIKDYTVLLILKEIKMVFQQQLQQSSMIQTVLLVLH